MSWFKPGAWAQATDPFDWPGSGYHHHGDGDGDDHAIAIMLEVLEIVRKAEERAVRTGLAADRRSGPAVGVMNFVRWIEPAIMEQLQ